MKIAVRGGHCPKVPGASKFIDELTEDRRVKDSVIKYLRMLSHEVLDVTPPDSTTTSGADLSNGVNRANLWNADLFVSIHFNKAYNIYQGSIGSEVCVYSPFDTAQRVVNGLASLGFKNRGQKVRTNLYELKNTKMKSMIIEVCFVEATGDVVLYRELGHDKIGKTIAESIADKKTENNTVNNTNKSTLPPVPRKYNEGDYLDLNPDVAQAVKSGVFSSGAEHYLFYGFKENRKISKEK